MQSRGRILPSLWIPPIPKCFCCGNHNATIFLYLKGYIQIVEENINSKPITLEKNWKEHS